MEEAVGLNFLADVPWPPEVRHALVAPPENPALLTPALGDPAVLQRVCSRERSPFVALGPHDASENSGIRALCSRDKPFFNRLTPSRHLGE